MPQSCGLTLVRRFSSRPEIMKFFRKKKEVSIKHFAVKSISNLLNDDLDITLIDPEEVLSTAERKLVINLSKPFGIAALFRATLKEIETRKLTISGEALVQHFVAGIYLTYRDNQVSALEKTTEETFERVQQFLHSATEIAPDDPYTKATVESVFGTVFARDVLPDCDIRQPVLQRKFATVLYFAMTFSESLNKDVHAFFAKFIVTD